MNSLNSIIIEGNLIADPETKNGSCEFQIESKRFYKVDGKPLKEISVFNISAKSKVAEKCQKHLHKGRGCRVVGRLEQTDKSYAIIAEHVEFKPEEES